LKASVSDDVGEYKVGELRARPHASIRIL